MKKVIYRIIAPRGFYLPISFRTCKDAKTFLIGINYNIPSWHYDELYRMEAVVVDK